MDSSSYIIGTVNINNITNKTKLEALHHFVRSQDVDILLLQEVENSSISIQGFNIIFNVDHTRRGTAIALKSHIKYTHVERSLDTRLIAVRIHDKVTIINIYAPSGTQNRASREPFFNTTLAYYLRRATEQVIIGGDFNAIIHPKDATGESNFSLSLKNTVQQAQIHDVWDRLRRRVTQHTYITHNSASRIDRIYVSTGLLEHLRNVDTHVCSFTNHHALTVRLWTDTRVLYLTF